MLFFQFPFRFFSCSVCGNVLPRPTINKSTGLSLPFVFYEKHRNVTSSKQKTFTCYNLSAFAGTTQKYLPKINFNFTVPEKLAQRSINETINYGQSVKRRTGYNI